VRHKAQEVTLLHTADQLQRELSGVRQDLTTATTTIDELTQQLRVAKESRIQPPQTGPLAHRDLMSTPQPTWRGSGLYRLSIEVTKINHGIT